MKENMMKENMMNGGKEMIEGLLYAIWNNVLGPDVLDNGDYNEIYKEQIENGECPEYEDFSELRWRFRNGDMTIEEADRFMEMFL